MSKLTKLLFKQKLKKLRQMERQYIKEDCQLLFASSLYLFVKVATSLVNYWTCSTLHHAQVNTCKDMCSTSDVFTCSCEVSLDMCVGNFILFRHITYGTGQQGKHQLVRGNFVFSIGVCGRALGSGVLGVDTWHHPIGVEGMLQIVVLWSTDCIFLS